MTDLNLPKSTMRMVALYSLLFAAPIVSSQELQNLTIKKQNIDKNESAQFTIHTSGVNESAWCGLRIEFGNGDYQDIRLGEKGKVGEPITISYRYGAPGSYIARVDGKLLIRGLKSVIPCLGKERSIQVLVEDIQAQKIQEELRNKLARQESERELLAEKERQLAAKEAELKMQEQRAELERSQKAVEEREKLLRAREKELADKLQEENEKKIQAEREASRQRQRAAQSPPTGAPQTPKNNVATVPRDPATTPAQRSEPSQSATATIPQQSTTTSGSETKSESTPKEEPPKSNRPSIRSATDI